MKFSDSELILLSNAAKRDDRAIAQLKGTKATAMTKPIARMLKQRVLEEVEAGKDLPVFRQDDEKGPLALLITKAGMAAIGVIEAPAPKVRPTSASKAPAKAKSKKATEGPKGKLGKLVEMLRRPKGATLDELTKATGWQTHSVRGAMSGSLKKKLGLNVTSDKSGSVRTYRIGGEGG